VPIRRAHHQCLEREKTHQPADGIDDEDLYIQAYTNLTGSEPPEDADLPYIAGVVDGLLTFDSAQDEDDEDESEDDEPGEDDRADSTDSLRYALGGVAQAGGDPVVSYRARQAEAWKRPLTATK